MLAMQRNSSKHFYIGFRVSSKNTYGETQRDWQRTTRSVKIDQLTALTGRVLQDILPWKESQNEGHH